MLRRILVAFLVASFLIAVPASALAAIRFKKIAFDPAGRDTGTNRHLNQEWVLIKNTGPRPKQLRGWTISDRGRDHVYRFRPLYLQPGDTVRLHTGRGDDGAPACEAGTECPEHSHYDMYWGLDNYVWNNDGDRATLKNSVPKVVDTCLVPGGASPVRC